MSVFTQEAGLLPAGRFLISRPPKQFHDGDPGRRSRVRNAARIRVDELAQAIDIAKCQLRTWLEEYTRCCPLPDGIERVRSGGLGGVVEQAESRAKPRRRGTRAKETA